MERYAAVYGQPDGFVLTRTMVLEHWELERRLTRELLASAPEERWDVFERCYTSLYEKLWWLNRMSTPFLATAAAVLYRDWVHLIGAPPQRIFEVGSGRGALIAYLAACGHECRGTEITRERGELHVPSNLNITWEVSDGVHLDQFETSNDWDVVISDQVVEHLHPDDVVAHFTAAHAILRAEGRYIVSTPHRYAGPADISALFGCVKSEGMHLHEYTYAELRDLGRQAGFQRTEAVFRKPRALTRILPWGPCARPNHAYLVYLIGIERLLSVFKQGAIRRKVANLSRVLLFRTNMVLVFSKTS